MSGPVRIRGIAAGGDGVATLADGRAVFVPRTAPGEVVELKEVRLTRRFARARVARVLEPSPDRVVPPCPHYEADDCGSCQLQHLSGAAQREARRRLVGEALRRIGKLDLPDPALEPSESEWDYRTKITLAARGRRIGYHRLGDPGRVFDLVQCPIARPELNGLWEALRRERRLLPDNLDQVVLRVDRDQRSHAVLKTRPGNAWTGARRLGEAVVARGSHPVLWWQPPDGAPRTVYGVREAYPVMVFEQVHPAMGDRVRRHAVAELGELQGRHVWDLYAGIGETTRLLLEGGATVESVELDARAVRLAEAEEAGRAVGVTRHTGRVEDLITHLKSADAAVLNPPRSGLHEAVPGSLAPRLPDSLVYISCDPATLARDLARLRDRYRVVSVRAFDLFPQTAHVETVARLEAR